MSEPLAKGVMTMMVAGIVSKLLGAIYRLPLARIIGAEGMGIYEMAYPVYSLLLVMAVSGVPIAVSKLVSEQVTAGQKLQSYRVFAVAIVFLIISGTLFSWIMYQLAEPLSVHVLGDPRVVYSLKAVSPAILLVSLMSAFRGYFQGLRIMSATACSQVGEQLVRVTTTLVLAYTLVDRGIAYGAAGATFGAVTGAVAGLSIMVILIPWYQGHWRDRGKSFREGISGFLKTFIQIAKALLSTVNLVRSLPLVARLLSIAIPVSMGALMIPVIQTLDAIIIPQRLQVAGFSASEATHLYGLLSGMALRLVSLPTTLSLALAVSLVPVMSENVTLGNYDRIRLQVQKALRLTLLFAVPSSVGLFVMSERLTTLLFGYPEAGVPLQFLAAGTIFLSFQQVTASVLQGVGSPFLPVKNLVYGALVNVVINYNLTAIPEIGINGGALGTCAGFMIASGANLWDVRAQVGRGLIRSLSKMSIKPLLSAIIMAIIIINTLPPLDRLIGNYNLATVAAIFLGIISYTVLLFTMGGIKRQDLEQLPVIGSKFSDG